MAFATPKTGMEEIGVLQYFDCLVDHGRRRGTVHMQHIVRQESIASRNPGLVVLSREGSVRQVLRCCFASPREWATVKSDVDDPSPDSSPIVVHMAGHRLRSSSPSYVFCGLDQANVVITVEVVFVDSQECRQLRTRQSCEKERRPRVE